MKITRLLLSLTLCMTLLMSLAPAQGTDAGAVFAPNSAEVALNGRVRSSVPVHIRVGTPTKVSGFFFTDQFSTNTSDIDVRNMIHGYSPVYWSTQLEYEADPTVVSSLSQGFNSNGDLVYTVTLNQGLLWNDGVTPVTAADYVFALLLQTSDEFAAIGASTGKWSHIAGYDAYAAGQTDILSGVRLLDEYTFSMTVLAAYLPSFYELNTLLFTPCPISVIAPGCEVADEGDGAFIRGSFNAAMLQNTILDPVSGYMSHPGITCGPYSLIGYDSVSGEVAFAINPWYAGNWDGVVPYIDQVTLVPVTIADMMDKLASGEVDVLDKVSDGADIMRGVAMSEEGFGHVSFARMGYSFIGVACEKGPQQFTAVRQALAYLINKDVLISDYLNGFALPSKGYYGLGQWMAQVAMGVIRPENLTEDENAVWDQFTLDDLNDYSMDYAEALRLLQEDGWTLNKNGKAFKPGRKQIRYKLVNDELMPLSFRFAKAAGSTAADVIVEQLKAGLAQLGGELIVEEVPFTELLADYEQQRDRKYDLSFLGYNFASSFDPYYSFAPVSEKDAFNVTGLQDEMLTELSWQMHCTEHGDIVGYEQRWLAFQQRYNEMLPTIPVYTNVYFDFFNQHLQNFNPHMEYSWATAMIYAWWNEDADAEEVDTMEDEFLTE